MSVRKNQNFLKMSLVLFFLGIIEQFEHMDPDPGTQINADRYGSGSVIVHWTYLCSRVGHGGKICESPADKPVFLCLK